MPVETRRGPARTQSGVWVTLASETEEELRVTLSMPVGAEECPLSLSPMRDESLCMVGDESGAPLTTFFVTMPLLKKLTMPCGHSFGALSLAYHFAQNDMRCPCCRVGVSARLRASSLPVHLSRRIARVVRRDTLEARQRQEEEDRGVAELMDAQVEEMDFGELRAASEGDFSVSLTTYVSNVSLPRVEDAPLCSVPLTPVLYDDTRGLVVLMSSWMESVPVGAALLTVRATSENSSPVASATPPFPVGHGVDGPECMPFSTRDRVGYIQVVPGTKGVFQLEVSMPPGPLDRNTLVHMRVVWYTLAEVIQELCPGWVR